MTCQPAKPLTVSERVSKRQSNLTLTGLRRCQVKNITIVNNYKSLIS